MAKVSFAKLGIKSDTSVKIIEYNNAKIEVKQYLPIEDKLELISNVINLAADGNNFYNPVKLDIFLMLQIIEKYTNLSITDKQKDDAGKLIDQFISSKLNEQIYNAIPAEELSVLRMGVSETVKSIYSYNNSVMGILDIIVKNYGDFKVDAESIQKMLADPKNLSLVKDILTKLG